MSNVQKYLDNILQRLYLLCTGATVAKDSNLVRLPSMPQRLHAILHYLKCYNFLC